MDKQNPFKDMFDLNKDGKTTASEEFKAYKLFEELIKEDHQKEEWEKEGDEDE